MQANVTLSEKKFVGCIINIGKYIYITDILRIFYIYYIGLFNFCNFFLQEICTSFNKVSKLFNKLKIPKCTNIYMIIHTKVSLLFQLSSFVSLSLSLSLSSLSHTHTHTHTHTHIHIFICLQLFADSFVHTNERIDKGM